MTIFLRLICFSICESGLFFMFNAEIQDGRQKWRKDDF